MPVAAHGDPDPGVIPTRGQLCRMRLMTCRKTRAASSPDGRLPGRSSDRTGLPVAASKMWMGWKQYSS
jgi:hypothetical protein